MSPAAPLYEEGLAIHRDLGNQKDIPAVLHNLAYVALARQDDTTARTLHGQSLLLHQKLGNQEGMAEGLTGLAAVACVRGQYERTAQLLGVVESLREVSGSPVCWPAERLEYERTLAVLYMQLDETAIAAAWAAGRALPLSEAIPYAWEAPRDDA